MLLSARTALHSAHVPAATTVAESKFYSINNCYGVQQRDTPTANTLVLLDQLDCIERTPTTSADIRCQFYVMDVRRNSQNCAGYARQTVGVADRLSMLARSSDEIRHKGLYEIVDLGLSALQNFQHAASSTSILASARIVCGLFVRSPGLRPDRVPVLAAGRTNSRDADKPHAHSQHVSTAVRMSASWTHRLSEHVHQCLYGCGRDCLFAHALARPLQMMRRTTYINGVQVCGACMHAAIDALCKKIA